MCEHMLVFCMLVYIYDIVIGSNHDDPYFQELEFDCNSLKLAGIDHMIDPEAISQIPISSDD